MKFARTLKPLRQGLDVAPFLCVLFPLAFFMTFGGMLVLPAGTRIELPPGDARPVPMDGAPYLVLAVDASEQCYFENQVVPDTAVLRQRIAARVAAPGGPRRLHLQAHHAVRNGKLAELGRLAGDAGIREIILGSTPAARAR
jgi:biopolymer transport protein ExbD